MRTFWKKNHEDVLFSHISKDCAPNAQSSEYKYPLAWDVNDADKGCEEAGSRCRRFGGSQFDGTYFEDFVIDLRTETVRWLQFVFLQTAGDGNRPLHVPCLHRNLLACLRDNVNLNTNLRIAQCSRRDGNGFFTIPRTSNLHNRIQAHTTVDSSNNNSFFRLKLILGKLSEVRQRAVTAASGLCCLFGLFFAWSKGAVSSGFGRRDKLASTMSHNSYESNFLADWKRYNTYTVTAMRRTSLPQLRR